MEVVGPTQSGKTSFVAKLIENQHMMLEQPFDEIFWFSPHDQHENDRDGITFMKEFPVDDESWNNLLPLDGKHRCIVVDDFGSELKNSSCLTKLYIRASHHRNTSLIQMLQNLFWHSKENRTRSLNIHYLVLMKQSRDRQQICTLSRQFLLPGKTKYFMSAYDDAIKDNYGYLMLSFHPRTPVELMIRSRIFPDEEPHVVYKIV